jgi:hypothetical protein
MHIQGSENGDQLPLPRMHLKCFLSVNYASHQTGQDAPTKVLSSSVYSMCTAARSVCSGLRAWRVTTGCIPSFFHNKALIVTVELPEMRRAAESPFRIYPCNHEPVWS